MAAKPIVFALANPDPEIEYHKAINAVPDIIFATGRSDYPNQINNVLGFPYIFRGALDCSATAINEEMKLAAVRAIAGLAKQPVPLVVNSAYNMSGITFGREYILPKPLDPRLLTTVAPAVASAAIESGVARKPITDWEQYSEKLNGLMGYDSKLVRRLTELAKNNPRRVVFGEGNTDNMLLASVDALREGVCKPVLLGNEEMIEKRAARLGVSLEGIEIINLRHDREAERRERYAVMLSDKCAREGLTRREALERMYDRNYFGMMMVEAGDADAFIAGTYSNSSEVASVAEEVIGIRPSYDHFATMHIMNTKKGVYFLADTMINKNMDTDTLVDVARLARIAVEYFAKDPVMAMVSYSNFGADKANSPRMVHDAVAVLHERYPDLLVDGEMQINYALNKTIRDKNYPFNKLNGKDVNTLIFPNLSAASSAYRIMLEMGLAEFIGPIQIGLNKPVHFISVEASVRDIVNLATIASIDATACEKGNSILDK